jgi:prepilin-type N-terminal cleavage/methylation domain-containing protein
MRHSTSPVPASRRAFTLVELLIVLAVIAILITLLLPVASRARDQANRVKCLSNLRNIGTALVAYQGEHGGAFPITYKQNIWKPWSSLDYGAGWADPAITTGDQFSWTYHKAMVNNPHRLLMKYLGGRKEGTNKVVTLLGDAVYRCPTAIAYPGGDRVPDRDSNTNYAFNGVLAFRRLLHVKRPAEIIAFSEGRYAWDVSTVRPYPTGNDIISPADLRTREYYQWLWIEDGTTAGQNVRLNLTLHSRLRAGSVVFIDGHAETLDYRDARPGNYGLGSSQIGGGGLVSDTYKVMTVPNLLRSYSAQLER